MSTSTARIEPEEVAPKQLEDLSQALLDKERPKLVGRGGLLLTLPDPIFNVLLKVVTAMRKGQSMLLMPEDETFTTQAAANYLGVSRPFLIKLLEGGQIPFFSAGSHRKVKLQDLRKYDAARSMKRRDTLDKMTKEAHDADLYDNEVDG